MSCTLKTCSKCKEELPLEDFYKKGNYSFTKCKKCYNESSLEYYEKNKERLKQYKRDYQLETRYGITKNEWNKMLNEQKGVCSICGCKETSLFKGIIRPLSVDHDHKTGKIRGLLCNDCNNGLSKFKDNPLILIKSVRYLMK